MNTEAEEFIPINQQNPIVLLERMLVEKHSFEATYDGNSGEFHDIEPVLETADPLNEGNVAIKYEIIHDYGEVDDILNDTCLQTKNEISEHPDDDIDRCERIEKTILSTSGSWNIETILDTTALHFGCKLEAGMTNDSDQSEAIDVVSQFDTAGGGGTNHTVERAVEGEANTSKVVIWQKADDEVLFVEPDYWPAAKTFELTGFVKRENDRFSGSLPFSLKVCILYMCDMLISSLLCNLFL